MSNLRFGSTLCIGLVFGSILTIGCAGSSQTSNQGTGGATYSAGGTVATGGESGVGNSAACVPGETQRCVGSGACSGGQVCKPDGSGWGTCDCGTATGGAPGSGGFTTAGGVNNIGGSFTTAGSSAGGSSSTGGTAAAGTTLHCNAAAQCSCLRVAELGNAGTFGASQTGTTMLQQWMNSKSTANVDVYEQRVTLTSDFLANYDILILQALSDRVTYTQQSDYWTFTAAEVSAVSDWVRNAGGAIIALTGYSSDNSYEINPANQLLQFSGISFNGDDIIQQSDCPMNSTNQQVCYCWNNSIPITNWNVTDPIALNVTAIGAWRGRSINAPAGANIVATFQGHPLVVSHQLGNGRIVAIGDEWISYVSQWNGSVLSQPATSYTDPYNPCYQKTPSQVFQTPQFWYNIFKWLNPLAACFTIDDPSIIGG